MDEHLLRSLGKRLSLTDLNETEEYILTHEEEQNIIAEKIKSTRLHEEWKLKNRDEQLAGILSNEEIESRLAQMDFKEKIDIPKVLAYANSCKHQEIWHREQREKEKEKEERDKKELEATWTAKNFFKMMKYVSKAYYDKDLIVNEHTKFLITVVCYFLSGDPRFETELGFNLKRGLLVRGISGLGKTFTFQCVADNAFKPINIISALEIQERVKETGNYRVDMGGRKILYIDDVGTEEKNINHYGNKIPWIKNFLELYYMQNRVYSNLIISTNNNFDQIEEKYGFRVRSRCKDMFNIIDVSGEDMRGK